MRSKGQVTLFVIIGLVLLLVVGLFAVLRSGGPSSREEPVAHDFSSSVASYQAHAERCLQQGGQQAFSRLFLNGGYADPAQEGFVAIEQFPTKGSALLFGDRLVPFWIRYEGSLGCEFGCSLSDRIPPLVAGSGKLSVEERAQSLMPGLVRSCLDDFDLGPDYEVRMGDRINVSVLVGEDGVSYGLSRDVNITFLPDGSSTVVDEVSAFSRSDIYKLYQDAVAFINQLELSNSSSTLGGALKTIIQSYGLTDDPEIPPMYGPTLLDAKPAKYWLLPEVKDSLRRHFADNLQFVQVVGSDEEQLFLDDNHFSQAIYQSGPFSLAYSYPYPEVIGSTSFDLYYDPSWNFELDVYPGNGQLIMPDTARFLNLLPGFSFGITDYSFGYDLRVPVLVVLKDAASFDGQGITLMFALESGLVNNQPLFAAGNITVDDGMRQDLFSDQDQWSLDEYEVRAVDGITGEPLPGARLSYVCGADTADLGVADEDGMVTTSLPYCWGGLLAASLEGYSAKNVPFDVSDDEGGRAVDVELVPLRDYDVEVRTYKLFKTYVPDKELVNESLRPFVNDDGSLWLLGNQPGSLGIDDQVTLTLEKQASPGEDEVTEVLFLNGTNQYSQTVTLGLGSYSVEGLYMLLMGEDHQRPYFEIPEGEVCWKEKLKKKCETIPSIRFNDTMLAGGVNLPASSGVSLNITRDNYAGDKLVINLIRIAVDDVQNYQDLEVLGMTDTFSLFYNETLRPVLVDSSASGLRTDI